MLEGKISEVKRLTVWKLATELYVGTWAEPRLCTVDVVIYIYFDKTIIRTHGALKMHPFSKQY